MRGVTREAMAKGEITAISTHTPHARRDFRWFLVIYYRQEFQLTRLMRGVTPLSRAVRLETSLFQLTRLMRGVTSSAAGFACFNIFQLTRLMRGVTEIGVYSVEKYLEFQLTRLMRGVT